MFTELSPLKVFSPLNFFVHSEFDNWSLVDMANFQKLYLTIEDWRPLNG